MKKNVISPQICLLAFAVLICFLLAHPYNGMWHDDILYAAQTLYRLNPAHYEGDLFFLFGSQDDLSIFSALHGKAVRELGIYHANLAALILLLAIWLTGAWRLAKNLLPTPHYWLALMLIVIMPRYYGAYKIFAYSETFLSARLPAEALGLWSIAFILERRTIIASVAAILAMLIHPIIGMVSSGLIIFLMRPRWRWWIAIILFLGTISILETTKLGLPLRFFDPIWLELTRHKSPFIFVTSWHFHEWSKACWILALPIMLAQQNNHEIRDIWGKVALIGIAGMVLTMLADVCFHDAFLIQIQSWRVLWLLSILQWPAIVILAHRLWPLQKATFALLLSCWFLQELGGGFLVLAVACVIWISQTANFSFNYTIPKTVEKPFLVLSFLILAIAIASWLAAGILDIPTAGAIFLNEKIISFQWLEGLIHTPLALAIACFLFFGLCIPHRTAKYTLTAVLIFLAAYALFNLDQRTPTSKFIDANADKPALAPFASIVKPGDMIYWDREVRFPWLLNKTAHYFSRQQSAGIVFHRETAIEALRRSARLIGASVPTHAITPQSPPEALGQLIELKEPNFLSLTQYQLHFVCQDPILDYVALGRHYPDWAIAEYKPAFIKMHQWLYDCNSLRKMPPPATDIQNPNYADGVLK